MGWKQASRCGACFIWGGVFASLAPGCSVLAFAAQSALDAAIAPFEGRYRSASKLGDWSAPFNDTALGIQSAG